MKRSSFISFSIYLLLTLAFTYLYILTQRRPDEPFHLNENDPGLVVILQAFGQAAQEAAVEVGIWLRFVMFCVSLNILFFLILKFVRGFRIGETIFLILTTLTLSFISYALLHSVLDWIFGGYHAVTFTLLVSTFIICRWQDVTMEQHA